MKHLLTAALILSPALALACPPVPDTSERMAELVAQASSCLFGVALFKQLLPLSLELLVDRDQFPRLRRFLSMEHAFGHLDVPGLL